MSDKRGLIILRGGDRSLHKSWLAGPEARTWSLHISYYGKNEQPDTCGQSDVTWSNDGGRSKYAGLAECLKNNDFDLERYDYIAIPDDDILTSTKNWNRGFELCRMYGLGAAQLANHIDSFFTQDITLARPNVRLRYVTRIESQIPIFRTDVFKRLAEYFPKEGNLWGMDYVAPYVLRDEPRSMAILDEAVGLHTRAHGVGAMYAKHRAEKTDMFAIQSQFLQQTGIPEVPAEIVGALDLNGQEIASLWPLKRRRVRAKLQQMWRERRGIVSIAHNDSKQLKTLRRFPGMPDLPLLSLDAARSA
ncbi:MAG: hypothetical protein AAFX03_09010 [Pseudomonadota bacterium]